MKKFQQWMLNRKADLLILPDVTIAILIVLPIIIIILINVPNVHLIQLVLPAHPDPFAQPDRFIAQLSIRIAQLVPLVRLHKLVPLVLLLLHTHLAPPVLRWPPKNLAFILIPFWLASASISTLVSESKSSKAKIQQHPTKHNDVVILDQF